MLVAPPSCSSRIEEGWGPGFNSSHKMLMRHGIGPHKPTAVVHGHSLGGRRGTYLDDHMQQPNDILLDDNGWSSELSWKND